MEELRIGQLGGEDEYIFGEINGIAVGKNGRIFVADYQVPIIRMYDKDGTFIRNIGRKGRGPGEYLRISGMKTFPDGRLAVWDVRNLRINVYSHDGKFNETHSVASRVFGSPYVFLELDHTGNFFVLIDHKDAGSITNPAPEWAKVTPKGEVVDTLSSPVDMAERPQSFVLFTASGDAHAFTERMKTTISPMGYLITGRNDEYSFTLLYPDSTKKEIRRNFEPVEIKPEEKKQWEAWVRYYDVVNTMKETKPAYKDILTDSQGRIWVHRYVEAEYTELNIGPHFGPESRWWEPPTFDVFLPDGFYHATVILPMNVKFFDAKDNRVWALLKGEYGEPYVARFRLEEMDGEPDIDG